MKRVRWDAGHGVTDMSNLPGTPADKWFKLVSEREVSVAKGGATVRLRIVERLSGGGWKAVVIGLDDGDDMPDGLTVGDEVAVDEGSVQTYW